MKLIMKKLFAFIGAYIFIIGIYAQKTELTLSDAVLQQYRKFYPTNTKMVNWIPGTTAYSYLSSNNKYLMKYDFTSDKSDTLISTDELVDLTKVGFPYINVLKWVDANTFYTASSGNYYLIDVAKKSVQTFAKLPVGAANDNFHFGSNQVAYTLENDLYFKDKNDIETRVTNFPPEIVSGQSIARNEFGISGGIFWSPTGNYLAFYQKDESEVADYPLLDITTPTGSLMSIKYPMAGQASEKPSVGIYNVKTGKTVYIKPTGKTDDYLTNVGWGLDDQFLYLVELNREQNHAKLIQYNAETGALVKVILEEKNDRWVEPEHAPYFIDANQFLWFSEKDGFMNLYLYSINGELIKQVTNNKWVTHEILGKDAKGNIYFSGTGVSPLETQYFCVNLKSGKQIQLTTESGTHHAIFNQDFSYYFDQYSAHEVPNAEYVKSTFGKMVKTIIKADNPYASMQIGEAEIGKIKSADGETDLYYRLIKPSNFDATKKYPVLVYVYGGPHAQMITNSWLDGANLWMYWLAEKGYLVYTVDNRGSDNRGFEFESVIHRQLGTAEMDDQLQGVAHLKSLPYVDAERLAVHGWSFGGFMTTSLMLRHPGVFTVGVAGGPVTDWAYYEVMYGERYMDKPDENEAGYKTNRLMNYVDKLQGKLLLIHGTIDDVVVMQHNYSLVKSFVEAGVQMDFFPYPMHPHNVRGKDRVHLMTKVLNYVQEYN